MSLEHPAGAPGPKRRTGAPGKGRGRGPKLPSTYRFEFCCPLAKHIEINILVHWPNSILQQFPTPPAEKNEMNFMSTAGLTCLELFRTFAKQAGVDVAVHRPNRLLGVPCAAAQSK